MNRHIALTIAGCLAVAAPAHARPVGAAAQAPSAAALVVATARFAIVIGNNRSASPRTAALRFADDDALATHQLLVGAGVQSVLLTRLDDTSRQLHPGAAPDGAPRWTELHEAFERFAQQMQRERSAGRPVELFLFYSGHGDVEHGEGYVLLEDRPLTRSLLLGLLERSPATRNHVVIDACKSYFLAFEKGPGGHRTPFSGRFAVPGELSAERLANTGFVLSTSSDRDSHEWERFQGGVFSHEVRSALLGAADVDRDARISYAELGAFLTIASQAVANPRFRPDFLIRPPGGTPRDLAETLLRWDAPAYSAVVIDQPIGHVFVETATGERVLDVHPAPEQELVVRVPAARPLFVRRGDTSGGEYLVGAEGTARISELVARVGSYGRRGAAQLAFEELFAVPFGSTSVRDYSVRWAIESGPRATSGAEAPDRDARATLRRAAGTTAIAAGVLGAATTGLWIERLAHGQSASQAERVRTNRTLRRLAIGTGALASVALVSGGVWFALRDRGDSIDIALLPITGDPALADPAPGLGVTLGRTW